MRDLEWSAKAQQFWCSLRPLEFVGRMVYYGLLQSESFHLHALSQRVRALYTCFWGRY